MLLTLDLGTYGKARGVLPGMRDPDAVRGMQLVCRRDSEGVIVVAAHSHAKGIVPLQPAQDVEPGTLVS